MPAKSNKDSLHLQSISKAEEAMASLRRNADMGPHHLNYHFTAPISWMNDPNGLIYYRGEYHMFYQIHPFSPENGPKHWGHAKSKDLVFWEHLPIALAPSEDHDMHGCFSGTAVENNGLLILIYTGNVHSPQKKQVQCIATSEDGLIFTKHPGNPVINQFPEDGTVDFRDPKVWKHEGVWYMAIGSGKAGMASALLYQSTDLFNWEYTGKMAESNGSQGKIWNCPDFFELDGKDVLLASPAVPYGVKNTRKSIYMIGKMNYENGKFTQEIDGDVDHGPDFYAPQTWIDHQGRVILIGWMDMWWNPMPTQDYGWTGAMTLPRLVTMSRNGKLLFEPVPELQTLRKNHRSLPPVKWSENHSGIFKNICGDSLEIIVEFDLQSCTAEEFGLKVRCSHDDKQKTLITYKPDLHEVTIDRQNSGTTNGERNVRNLPPRPNHTVKWHLFLDRSSIELFINDGELVMTNRIYPDPSSLGLDLFAKGGSVKVSSLDLWDLSSIW
ncbi:MAG TPA: glycoside hydrolase family 32 protein [Bacillales bacterium]|nr:glycoside hydrolase family 32 protein [Bacillales bacterium]